jgi:hypothetical protein
MIFVIYIIRKTNTLTLYYCDTWSTYDVTGEKNCRIFDKEELRKTAGSVVPKKGELRYVM